jgi:hypothetical protein
LIEPISFAAGDFVGQQVEIADLLHDWILDVLRPGASHRPGDERELGF